jgi:Zn-dependent M28 family amino/carboxypeptidase
MCCWSSGPTPKRWWWWEPTTTPGGPFPGADDNASGVAGLIELGKLLARAKLKSRVILAAYALEEPPHFSGPEMGSVFHARALRGAGKRVKGMISLEMIGYFSGERGSQEFPMPVLRLFYPSRGNFIAVVGNFANLGIVRRVKRSMGEASSLPVYSINAPALVPGIDFSDHRNFWAAGFPAVMVTDTAFYRNKAYHTAEDTPDRLDYERMAMVVAGAYLAVMDLAND